ncbi:MAG: hypothetical protein ACI8O8_001635 [Oleiphilaceae bacterium]|jgi:hypothetical protein
MRITKLSLTNFRSFKETQTIEFAPVTLLFGPNSVGKSTVLLALFYLQQILAKGQCDPKRLEPLGDKVIGGFKSLVNGRDINKSIKIKVEFEKGNEIGSSYVYLGDYIEDQLDFTIGSPSIAAKTIALEFQISWSKAANTAYISNYSVWFDSVLAAVCESDSSRMQPQLTLLNYLHPLLLPNNQDEWLQLSFEDRHLHSAIVNDAFELNDISIPSDRDIANGAEDVLEHYLWEEDYSFSDECFVTALHDLLASGSNSLKTDVNGISLMHSSIGIAGIAGAIPQLGIKLSSSLSLDSEIQTDLINEILSDIIVAPLDNLLTLLQDSICIGPVRKIPDPNYQANPYPAQHDWYDGTAAWDILARGNSEIHRDIDKWMSNEDKLGLGYGLATRVDKEFTELKRFKNGIKHADAESQLESMIKGHYSEKSNTSNPPFDEQRTKHSYSIVDISNYMSVHPSEIGVGVSQLMPLIVATFQIKRGFIACEQPELHVHPRIQVAIGDMLTQGNRSSNFLIETHSEHLILRLLKRIRQSSDNELPVDFIPVKDSDISLVYLEPSEDGVVTKRIHIDDDGEFVEKWPNGFFIERREEFM